MKSFEYFQKDTVNMKSESKFTEIFHNFVFHEEWQNHFSFQEPQRWMLPKQVSWLMWNEICRNFIHCYKPKFDVLRVILPENSKPFWHKLRTLFAHFWRLEFVNESRELLLKCLWMIHQEIRTHFVHFATKIWDELPWNSETLRPLWWFHILTWNLKSIRSRHVETIFLKENK